MSPKKLTDATKTEILKLYRETEATTSTLADRYEVSSSTISRFLKSFLTETEYEDLIQQKRLARTPRRNSSDSDDEDQSDTDTPSQPVLEQLSLNVSAPKEEAKETVSIVDVTSELPEGKSLNLYKIKQKPIKIERQNSADEKEPQEDKQKPAVTESQFLAGQDEFFLEESESSPDTILKKDATQDEDDEDLVNVNTLEEMFGEDIDDLDEDDEEDDWDDEDDERDYRPESFNQSGAGLQVLPFSAAAFPKTCYLVIDRFAELITRPLKDFAELGKIPPQEVQQRTLPVFDSHRVARRFSKRRERVIKVPDGQLLQKVHSHLEAKGITRLLIDGRIYTLTP
ncbi:MAG: hypothetical protein N5P05_001960 [Chroococcopsis gigantea SAG 12.99]|jgi:transposase-like protein|nr:transposase [Chlorogloea purpurea SAG 13.99]MDV3000354.1 hypothetical protein [Chroococcopsis gigantea SAG 12.99]